MRNTTLPTPKNVAKRAYRKPLLVHHGRVNRITLKAGSAVDVMTGANDMQV